MDEGPVTVNCGEYSLLSGTRQARCARSPSCAGLNRQVELLQLGMFLSGHRAERGQAGPPEEPGVLTGSAGLLHSAESLQLLKTMTGAVTLQCRMKMLLSLKVQCADLAVPWAEALALQGLFLRCPTPALGHPAQSCTQARGSGLGEENRLVKLLSKHFSYPNTNAFATPVPQGHVSH